MSGRVRPEDVAPKMEATIREGNRVKSILTDKIYEVKTIKDRLVVLQSPDGLNQVWTEKENLKLFYKKVEREEALKVPLSPSRKRPLRSPSKVVLDFL